RQAGPPVLVGELRQRRGRVDAGSQHQVVDHPEASSRRLDDLLVAPGGGHVGWHGDGLGSVSLQFLRQGGQSLCGQVRQHETGSGTGEAARDLTPDTSGGTGEDEDAAGAGRGAGRGSRRGHGSSTALTTRPEAVASSAVSASVSGNAVVTTSS